MKSSTFAWLALVLSILSGCRKDFKEDPREAIRKLGGTHTVDFNKPDWPVVAVNLRLVRAVHADDCLVYLKEYPELREVVLSRHVTDKGLAHLEGLVTITRSEERRVGKESR